MFMKRSVVYIIKSYHRDEIRSTGRAYRSTTVRYNFGLWISVYLTVPCSATCNWRPFDGVVISSARVHRKIIVSKRIYNNMAFERLVGDRWRDKTVISRYRDRGAEKKKKLKLNNGNLMDIMRSETFTTRGYFVVGSLAYLIDGIIRNIRHFFFLKKKSSSTLNPYHRVYTTIIR